MRPGSLVRHIVSKKLALVIKKHNSSLFGEQESVIEAVFTESTNIEFLMMSSLEEVEKC